MERETKSISLTSNALLKISNQIAIGDKLLEKHRDFYFLILKIDGELKVIENIEVLKEELDVIHFFKIPFYHLNTIVILSTSNGIYFTIKATKLIELLKVQLSIKLQSIINYNFNDEIISVIVYNKEESNISFIIHSTAKGIIKKSFIDQYLRVSLKGKKAISLRENDEVIASELIQDDTEYIMLASKFGKVCRFEHTKVRPMGKNASGVLGITLENSHDRVIGFTQNKYLNKEFLVCVSENGFIKRTYIDDPEDGEAVYRITNRGFKGVKAFDITKETGYLRTVACVHESNNNLILIGTKRNLRLKVNDVPIQNRIGMGIKLIDETIVRIFER